MKILNFGSMNIDYVYSVQHIVQPGETVNASKNDMFPGGKGLNQSVAIAKAGGDVFHAGIIGEDGEILLDALVKAGVNIKYVKRVLGASGHTVIQVDESGQNGIIVFANKNIRPTEDDIDNTLKGFESGDFLILQNELYNSPLMMKKAASKGLKVVFNPSPFDSHIVLYPLECVNWFILNEFEGNLLSDGETEPERILATISQKYAHSSIVLTLGSNGAYCYHKGKVFFQEAFKVNATDTTAAGDTFSGYFIASIANNMDIPSSLLLAAKAASITVCRHGASDSIPTLEDLG